jgi:hypothetical protein
MRGKAMRSDRCADHVQRHRRQKELRGSVDPARAQPRQEREGQPADPVRQQGDAQGPSDGLRRQSRQFPVGEGFRPTDIQQGRPGFRRFGRCGREVGAMDRVDPPGSGREKPDAPGTGHRQELFHVREIARRRDHSRRNGGGAQGGHEGGFRGHERDLSHCVGIEDMDVDEAPDTCAFGLAQEVQVRLEVDIAVAQPVRLPGDAEGRHHQFRTVHQAVERLAARGFCLHDGMGCEISGPRPVTDQRRDGPAAPRELGA